MTLTVTLDRIKRGEARPELKFDNLWQGHGAHLAAIPTVAALLDRPKEAVALFKTNRLVAE